MMVPIQDGKPHQITHLLVTEAQKTLGIHTSPDGSNMAPLHYVEDWAQAWVAKMTTGALFKQLN